MTLAKALKQKNRLAQKINKFQQEIQRENSVQIDDPRKIKVEDLMVKLKETVSQLIKLKIAIFVASTPMRENILILSELKSEIVFLQSISTKEGKVSEYGDTPIEYTAAFDKLYIRDRVSKCEDEIDNIQDELDTFNHTTTIEI
jgi:hypothetical protein